MALYYVLVITSDQGLVSICGHATNPLRGVQLTSDLRRQPKIGIGNQKRSKKESFVSILRILVGNQQQQLEDTTEKKIKKNQIRGFKAWFEGANRSLPSQY